MFYLGRETIRQEHEMVSRWIRTQLGIFTNISDVKETPGMISLVMVINRASWICADINLDPGLSKEQG